MEGHGRSWKVKEGQGKSWMVFSHHWIDISGGVVACRIIVSARVPFLWSLDFGFWTWIWDLDLGLGFVTGLGLDNNSPPPEKTLLYTTLLLCLQASNVKI